MKRFLTIFVLLSIFVSAAAVPPTTVVLDIEGLGNREVQARFITSPELNSNGNPLNMEAVAENGRLVLHPQIKGLNIVSLKLTQLDAKIEIEGGVVTVSPTGGVIPFPIMPGDSVTVKGRISEGHVEYTITGSEIAEAAADYRAYTLADILAQDSLYIASHERGKGDAWLTEQLDKLYSEYADPADTPLYQWLSANRNSSGAGFIVLWYADLLPAFERYPELAENIRAEMFGPIIDAKLRREQKADRHGNYIALDEGADAPRFTLKTHEGNDISLDDITDAKYIVVDFWASWCSPCLSGIPRLKEYYAKYGGRMEIIGVAASDTQAGWLAALGKYEMPWPNVIDTNNTAASAYGVESLPTKVILDHNHRVVKVFVGEGGDFYKTLDELMK